MTQYIQGLSVDQNRIIKTSIRINKPIKDWLDRKTEKESLSLSSYLYEILNFCLSRHEPESQHDQRKELPHVSTIQKSYLSYMQLYKVKNSLYEDKICVYLDSNQMNEIQIGCQIYNQDVSEVVRQYLHFFFIADHYFKVNFDVADDLQNGLALSSIRMNYFMPDLFAPNI